MKLSVTVHDEPISKANALKFKWNRKKRRATGHIDSKFLDYEEKVRSAAKEALQGCEAPIFENGPVEIHIVYYLYSHRVKDLLNLPKTTCDALNGVFYRDDVQIVEAYCSKRYDKENPRVEIMVRRPKGQWKRKLKSLFWSLPPSYR